MNYSILKGLFICTPNDSTQTFRIFDPWGVEESHKSVHKCYFCTYTTLPNRNNPYFLYYIATPGQMIITLIWGSKPSRNHHALPPKRRALVLAQINCYQAGRSCTKATNFSHPHPRCIWKLCCVFPRGLSVHMAWLFGFGLFFFPNCAWFRGASKPLLCMAELAMTHTKVSQFESRTF